MAQQDTNVVSFTKKAPTETATQRLNARKIYTKCEELAEKLLAAVSQRMFDATDDTLFKFTETSEKKTEQGTYFDSMRLVRLQRDTITQRFIEAVKQDFASSLAGKKPLTANPASLSVDQMTLVEDSDLEETIAVKNTITKIRYQYPEELSALAARFAHLLPDAQLTDETNPIGPECICGAFLQATRALDVDIKVRLIVLKLFEHHIITGLKPLYDTINKLLIDANVLPVLKPAIIKSPDQGVTPASTPGAATLSGGMPNVPVASSGGTVAAGDMSLSYLHSLMSQYRQANSMPGLSGTAPAGAVASGGSYSPGIAMSPEMLAHATATLTSALTNLQIADAGLAQTTTAIDTGGLRQYVVTQLQKQGIESHAINPVDNDIIDIVSMLFEYILDDEQVPDAAKALLGKLQIPLLKAAILDKEFFATKGHPARALLNDMARAAMAVSNKDVEHATSLFGEIKRIVDIIIAEFKDDLALFTRLHTEFQNFMELFRYHETMAQETVAKIVKHKEDAALASKWVDESLREILQTRQLPAPLEAIITGPWKEVMLKTYLNSGQESDTWKNQVRYIEILHWSIQPKRISMDRAKLAGIIYQLVNALRNGLQTIGLPAGEITQILSQLEPYHMASIKGIRHDGIEKNAAGSTTEMSVDDITGAIKQIETEIAALTKMQEATFLNNEITDTEVMEDITLSDLDALTHNPSDQPQDEYLELARQLEQGKWIEFAGKRNQRIRAKLAYKSELLGEYTFLDWKHKVVADKTLYGLAADLRRGSAIIMDDAPIIDRALTAITKTLRGGKG